MNAKSKRHFRDVRASDVKASLEGIDYLNYIGGCYISIHLSFRDKGYVATFCDGEIFNSPRLSDIKKRTAEKMLEAYHLFDETHKVEYAPKYSVDPFPEYKLKRSSSHGYALTIYRQSGNVHAAWKCNSFDAAVTQMHASLNRVDMEPKIHVNTESKLYLILPFRGRKGQGKVINSYEIIALDEPYEDWVQWKGLKNTALTILLAIVMLVVVVISLHLKAH